MRVFISSVDRIMWIRFIPEIPNGGLKDLNRICNQLTQQKGVNVHMHDVHAVDSDIESVNSKFMSPGEIRLRQKWLQYYPIGVKFFGKRIKIKPFDMQRVKSIFKWQFDLVAMNCEFLGKQYATAVILMCA